jgi:hypothetical protein
MPTNKWHNIIKKVPRRFLAPDSPEEWKDSELTLYKSFKFHSADYQILIDIVKDHYKDAKGNATFTKARLLGVLWSQFWDEHAKFWERHHHPKTWMIRYAWKKMVKKYHLLFNTKYFKKQIMLCNIGSDVTDKMIGEK